MELSFCNERRLGSVRHILIEFDDYYFALIRDNLDGTFYVYHDDGCYRESVTKHCFDNMKKMTFIELLTLISDHVDNVYVE